MAFAERRVVSVTKLLIVAGAAATAVVLMTMARRSAPPPPALMLAETPPAMPSVDERPVRITEELVTTRPVSSAAPAPRRQPPTVARAQRRVAASEPRTGLARWFFGDGTHRPAPFPRPHRSTVK
jgi:hypothetical protein